MKHGRIQSHFRAVFCAFVIGLANGPARAADRVAAPGEGVICLQGIVTAVAEVGARCFPGQDAELQAKLHRDVARLDAFVLQNSKMTAEDLKAFKRDQAHVGAPEALVCHGDGPLMYKAFLAAGVQRLHTSVDLAVSHPGKPTWGTCL